MYKLKGVIQIMVYLLNETVYLKKDKYTFKDQLFWNNNNRFCYCFVAVKGGKVDCLLQSIDGGFKKDKKDKVIKDYLNSKFKTLDCGYSKLSDKAKPIIEITDYKVGE